MFDSYPGLDTENIALATQSAALRENRARQSRLERVEAAYEQTQRDLAAAEDRAAHAERDARQWRSLATEQQQQAQRLAGRIAELERLLEIESERYSEVLAREKAASAALARAKQTIASMELDAAAAATGGSSEELDFYEAADYYQEPPPPE